MTTLKEAALAYAERGWPIFPCNYDKTPATKNGVLDATTNPQKIEVWWTETPDANIGLDVGGAGMMVLDLDPGHDMKELEKNVGILPVTQLWARTPRGGKHLYFSLGEGEIIAPSASKLAPHVDVRSFHSYVLLAPSKTKDGDYGWPHGEGKPNGLSAAYRTDDLLRLCNSGREKHGDRDNWLIEADLPANVVLAIAWLKSEAQVSVQSNGGDMMAYKTAARLKGYGISEEKAFELMLAHWNPRCQPPWTDDVDHLEQKVKNAYSYNAHPPGHLTPGYRAAKLASNFTAIDKPAMPQAGRFRIINRDEIRDLRPPAWLIKNFIPQESYSLIVGAQSTFKTFLALDIALAVATGGPDYGSEANWLNVNKPGKVLFVAGEGRASIQNRVKAWEKIHLAGQEANDFFLGDPVPLVSEAREPFIEAALQKSKDGYRLVVLDTVGRAMQGLNENAQEHASNFTNLVQTLQADLGATVLALHHTGHGDQSRSRGSSVFGADADMIVTLNRHEGKDLVSVTMAKQKDAAEWNKIKFIQLDHVQLSPTVDTLVARKADKEEIPVAARREAKMTEEDLAALHAVEQTVLTFLARNKLAAYSHSAFAAKIATEEGITLSGETLRKKHLVLLRENSDRRSARCWDNATDRWRWQD